MQIATIIAVYADWGFARIKGIGWGWAGVIWLYSIIFFFPLDWFKFAIRYILSGKAWDNLLENKVTIGRLDTDFSQSHIFEHLVHLVATPLVYLIIPLHLRRLSLPRKIMVGKKGKLNGPWLRGLCMDSNPLKLLTFSLTRVATESFRK